MSADATVDSSLQSDKHRKKMERRKQVQDKRLAQMTDHKGLVIINTGDGKGKSSAAFGVVFRALGHGLKVGVVQFIKGAWEPGEAKLLRSLDSDLVEFHALGEGFTWETQDRDRDIANVQRAWEKSLEMMVSNAFHVVLLDEINIAIKLGYLSVNTVLTGLEQKPENLHVILTGRGAKPELIEQADLVTEMTLVKHPFREQGIKAQLGIEY
ncbi:MAG: cob(I)yrinic acid a,c-diamide adenosyltransferase [Cyanobacteria bacterium P01_E01_bin.34]